MLMQFGKRWLNRPVAEMIEQDIQYCLWLIGLAAFRDNHPVAYRFVRHAVIEYLILEREEDLA